MEFARVALRTVRGREGMDVRKAERGSGRGPTGARSTCSTLLKAPQSAPPQTCSKCKLCRVCHCGHTGVQHTASHPSQRWPGQGTVEGILDGRRVREKLTPPDQATFQWGATPSEPQSQHPWR